MRNVINIMLSTCNYSCAYSLDRCIFLRYTNPRLWLYVRNNLMLRHRILPNHISSIGVSCAGTLFSPLQVKLKINLGCRPSCGIMATEDNHRFCRYMITDRRNTATCPTCTFYSIYFWNRYISHTKEVCAAYPISSWCSSIAMPCGSYMGSSCHSMWLRRFASG